MAPQILSTKFYIPPVRDNLVPRPHLVRRLHTGLHGPLTLISAPAGFGKTTLLAEWRHSAEGDDFPLAWLSLEPDDNNVTRFLAYLITALGSLRPGLGEIALISLQSSQPPPTDTILTHLINELGEYEQPFVLVLDDYHVISTPAIHDTLAFVLDHRPEHMHLVILTRADPPLPLARLRARNQMAEIRAHDLRFTLEETNTLMKDVMGLALSAEDVAALERRTEGWIAGLQLAAMSMQGRGELHSFVSAFTGSHHYILDYLAEEVLDRQTEAMRSFLLQTSILDRLTGSLCDAVTDGVDGQTRLEALARDNSFIVSLDDERRWYRYHQLFADVLQSRLQRFYPQELAGLHCRAAEWYEQNNFVAEAISHALAARDQNLAVRLIEQNALAMLMRGEMATLLSWIKTVEPLAHQHPWLCIYQSWALTLTGQLDQVEAWLQEAEHLVASQSEAEVVQNMLGHMAAIRGYCAVQKGEVSNAIDLGQQALLHLPENDQAVRSVVTMTLGAARRLSGDLAGAVNALEQAVRTGQAAGNFYLALGALSSLADLWFDQGNLHQAFERYNQLLSLVTHPDGRRLPAAAMSLFGLSLIYYEWNDLGTALEYVDQSIELCLQWGHVGILIASQVMLFRVRLARGEVDSAREALNEAERLARAHPQAPRATSWVDAFRVRYQLAHGDQAAAIHWAEQSGLQLDNDVSYLREAEYFAFGHALLAQGEHTAALRWSERLGNFAEKAGRKGSMIEALNLQALTLQAAGENAQALAALERALSLAEPAGYLRVFLDEGAPMAHLLRQAGSRGIASRFVSSLLTEFDQLPGAAPTPQQPLIEPLSQRELEILRLVAAGKSNREVAADLVLSPGTVKSHLSHIFGKLNVESRTQCVARARALKLIS